MAVGKCVRSDIFLRIGSLVFLIFRIKLMVPNTRKVTARFFGKILCSPILSIFGRFLPKMNFFDSAKLVH